MLRYMLDTSICVRVLRRRPDELLRRFADEAGALCISTIVLAELLHGANKSSKPVQTRAEVEDFVSRLGVLPFDDRAASHAADIRSVLEAQGRLIGGYDILIAAHARSLGLVVVTGNLGEFSRVEGLRSEDW